MKSIEKIISDVALKNLPGNAESRGGDSHGSIGILPPLQPILCGSCEKCDNPRRRLSDFSCRRHLARRFWNQTWNKQKNSINNHRLKHTTQLYKLNDVSHQHRRKCHPKNQPEYIAGGHTFPPFTTYHFFRIPFKSLLDSVLSVCASQHRLNVLNRHQFWHRICLCVCKGSKNTDGVCAPRAQSSIFLSH